MCSPSSVLYDAVFGFSISAASTCFHDSHLFRSLCLLTYIDPSCKLHWQPARCRSARNLNKRAAFNLLTTFDRRTNIWIHRNKTHRFAICLSVFSITNLCTFRLKPCMPSCWLAINWGKKVLFASWCKSRQVWSDWTLSSHHCFLSLPLVGLFFFTFCLHKPWNKLDFNPD